MQNELSQYELKAFEEHEKELQEEEESITQAIKDFKLDSISRDELERKAARCMLKLNISEDLANRLLITHKSDTVEFLGFVISGRLIGKLGKAIKDYRAKVFRNKNGRPATIALKEIETVEYPKSKPFLHLTGRVTAFENQMYAKYPHVTQESIHKLVRRLNKENGIKAKK